jgi:lipopolysaccharide/colanic/teichoic acid biosynthesis glycosyltransferase
VSSVGATVAGAPRVVCSIPEPRTAPRPRPPLPGFMRSISSATWVVLDWLIIGAAAYVACVLLVTGTTRYGWIANRWLVSGAFCATTTMAGLVFGLYERRTLLARSRIFVRSTLTLVLGVVLGFACLLLFFHAAASRWVGLTVALAYALLAIPLRLGAHEVITTTRVRLLCVGDGPSIRKLLTILGPLHHRIYEVVGHVHVSQGPLRLVAGAIGRNSQAGPALALGPPVAGAPLSAAHSFDEACPCLGPLEQIADLVSEYHVDEVVVGSELASNGVVGRAVAACLQRRCRVTDQATFVEKLLGEVPIESITAEWFLRADVQNRGNYDTVSRLLSSVAAAVGLVLTLPLWPLIALAIRIDSRGPALFRQIRVGQYGRYFNIYKFRTMRTDAEKDGARWAQPHDARVTRVGRWLRQSRLDELPQLLNVLRGEMALVGPRPERPEFVHNLEQVLPHYRLRHLTRPGLTGWAQIHHGYGGSIADAHRKLCLDLYYLKHRALEMDVAILIRTLGTFLLGAR